MGEFHFQEELDAAMAREKAEKRAKTERPEKILSLEISKGQTGEIDGKKFQFHCMVGDDRFMMSVDGGGADFFEKNNILVFGTTKLKVVGLEPERVKLELIDWYGKNDSGHDAANNGFDAAISGGAVAGF